MAQNSRETSGGLTEQDRKLIREFLAVAPYRRRPEMLMPGEAEDDEPDGE